MTYQYWNEHVEKMPRKELEAWQLERLKETVACSLRTPFYQRRLSEAGITSPEDIKTLADLRRIPFTAKGELRDGFPYGFLAVPREEVIRLHASSGTTGAPTTIYFNRDDISRWTGFVARCIYGTGCTKADVFQNMITYGLFTGGLGFHAGGEEVGMLVIPSGP
ncbi:MAG: phenylacetate--CoA ligase, partial [Spirochaetaceae bacterium]|nr:phenylacetate--CoA ligase [Spirochaetaceae bacterium]